MATSAPRFLLQPELPVCQTDLPLDWYQEEFRPYAEEYLALPDRRPETLFRWLDRYVKPAQAHFGDALLLLAHFYMGGEIVKLVERYGGGSASTNPDVARCKKRGERHWTRRSLSASGPSQGRTWSKLAICVPSRRVPARRSKRTPSAVCSLAGVSVGEACGRGGDQSRLSQRDQKLPRTAAVAAAATVSPRS